MKAKKFLLLLAALCCVVTLVSTAFALEVEDALAPQPEESLYMVLRLDDTQNLLKWIFSKEHIDTFMPLILASEDSNEILGIIEMLSAFAENTPLKSAAILIGAEGNKNNDLSFKMAFTVKPEAELFVKKIADGSATAIDIAKLIIGKDNPMASLAESMIKVEKGDNNILRVDNELFMKAQDNMILVGLSANDIDVSLKALEDSNARLFANKPRKLAYKDFACFHVNPKSLENVDDDTIDVDEFTKYLEKPLDVELGFMRVPGKFLFSTALNIREALSKEYFERTGLQRDYPKVKGGYIDLKGAKSPLFAFGGMLNINGLKLTDEGRDVWKGFTRQAKNRFGITEDDLTKLFAGALSIVLNDNVSVEGIKMPAIYISQTGDTGTAAKIFGKLEKSPHFHKVQEGILQVDASVSPVSCLVSRNEETLNVNFAELDNISASTPVKPALQELLETEASSSVWLDFAAIQSWLLDPENGVLIIAEPLARFSGQGELFDAVKELLTSKFSVPSMTIRSDSFELIHTEFQIDEDVKAEEGPMSKFVKIIRKLLDFNKVETKPEKNK